MPAAGQILGGLERIANEWWFLAVLWHVYFATVGIALVSGWRPMRAVAGALLGAPLLCVSLLAWVAQNPFNGTAFALAGAISSAIAWRLPPARVRPGGAIALMLGVSLFLFGWICPHFLHAASPFDYLYAAPTGLLPCPTLSVVIGIGLALDGLGSRLWSGIMGVTGAFYGPLGAAYLGVRIDWVLGAGAALLFVSGTMRTSNRTGTPSVTTDA